MSAAMGKWVSLCRTVGYRWVTTIDGVKFAFNDLISLFTKDDSDRRKSVSL